MKPNPLGPLHFIVDLDVIRGDPYPHVQPLLDAGLPSLQLRGKGRTTPELVEAGELLRESALKVGAFFVVNGDLAAARALDADGVQLPSSGPSLDEARATLPDRLALGVSCHELMDLVRARTADWVFLSPVHPTPSKPGAPGLGIPVLRDLIKLARTPVYALGGITHENYHECFDAGAAGIAVIRGLLEDEPLEFLRAVISGVGRTG